MPVLTIVAGCNGAGKTTVARKVLGNSATDTLWINPDHTTDDLLGLYGDLGPGRDTANFLAATVTERRVDHALDTGRSVAVETVLSSTKYLSRIETARMRGFAVHLVYVILNSPELAVRRVSDRTSRGGHGVDPEKVRKRWTQSQHNLIRLIPLVDQAIIFDNSNCNPGQPPLLFATKREDTLQVHDQTALPFLRDLLKAVAGSGDGGFQLAGL